MSIIIIKKDLIAYFYIKWTIQNQEQFSIKSIIKL